MVSSDFYLLLDCFVLPVDMNLAEMNAQLARGELAEYVIAPFCCVLIIFKIV